MCWVCRRPPQWPDHQPAVGAQHGEMVGDGLGVGGADADVDERHALAVGRGEVIGGHLEAVPGAAGDQVVDLVRCMLGADDDVAGQHQPRGRLAGAELLARPAHEAVDVAVVVGEQNPALHMPPVAARVVHEALQRIVDAHRVEQRERARLALAEVPGAVGDLVAHGGELRRREVPGEVGHVHGRAGQLLGAVEHVRIGNALAARLHLDPAPYSVASGCSCSVR